MLSFDVNIGFVKSLRFLRIDSSLLRLDEALMKVILLSSVKDMVTESWGNNKAGSLLALLLYTMIGASVSIYSFLPGEIEMPVKSLNSLKKRGLFESLANCQSECQVEH